jgi:hypothetical protein
MDPILSQKILIYILTSYFKIYFNIIFPSTPKTLTPQTVKQNFQERDVSNK